MRGATDEEKIKEALRGISIHAPHAGSDSVMVWLHVVLSISIHAPHAGSDCFSFFLFSLFNDFNPRSPCGERLVCDKSYQKKFDISIHAPHAGSDPRQ